ncbi:fam-l protein [Plasmodium malariae]|uniref:Fam-l protein n=1 Tax=Plasmodium malariae TaxID=5858 RepID=A0A1D3JGU6_PLAMA|nr:fam-l protein [Plasmodium malariae]SBT85484.1 fam-l protein [Plasmodium malariae]
MEQNFKTFLFVKISVLVLLIWICLLNSDMMIFNNPVDVNCMFHIKIDRRNYRLLTKYIHDKNSIITGLKEDVPYNKLNKKKDISNNEKWETGKKELSSRCFSRNMGVDKKAMKNKSCIFKTKKYSHMEKKIFKELDYQNFLKKNRTITDKTYKKIIIKKYGLRLGIPVLLFLFFLIVFIVDFSLGFSKTNVSWERSFLGLWPHLKELTNDENGWLSTALKWLKEKSPGLWQHYGATEQTSSTLCQLCSSVKGNGVKISEQCILGQLFGYIFYFVPFIILGVTFISWIIYYHKKVKKYEKIKFRKR